MEQLNFLTPQHEPWNKCKLIGQKAPPRLKDINSHLISVERYAPRTAW